MTALEKLLNILEGTGDYVRIAERDGMTVVTHIMEDAEFGLPYQRVLYFDANGARVYPR